MLLISYHFPPGQGTGALRWQKMSAYAAERGWGLDVVTLDPSEFRKPDPSRLDDLPPGMRIYGVPRPRLLIERLEHRLWRVYRSLRPRRQPRGSSGSTSAPATDTGEEGLTAEEMPWPPRSPEEVRRAFYAWLHHARIARWARSAAALALRVQDPAHHRAVITSGPPHAAHQAGVEISRRSGLPLVIDLRDPWSVRRQLLEHFASPLYFKIADREEGRAVRQAGLVVANTAAARDAMQRTYPESAGRIIAVMNGYDQDPLPPRIDTTRFVAGYAGKMYLGRDPRLLFRAAARVVRDLGLGPDQFGFEFVGDRTDGRGIPIERLAAEEGLDGYVHARPRLPRGEALEVLAGASLLISFPHSPFTIPSKIFEYMRFSAWLLAFGEAGSPTELLLRGTGADIVAPDDVDGMVRVLRNRYLAFAAGERPSPLSGVERCSRRHQANLLFDAVEALVSSAAQLRDGGNHSAC